jgi:hypothetical protein
MSDKLELAFADLLAVSSNFVIPTDDEEVKATASPSRGQNLAWNFEEDRHNSAGIEIQG